MSGAGQTQPQSQVYISPASPLLQYEPNRNGLLQQAWIQDSGGSKCQGAGPYAIQLVGQLCELPFQSPRLISSLRTIVYLGGDGRLHSQCWVGWVVTGWIGKFGHSELVDDQGEPYGEIGGILRDMYRRSDVRTHRSEHDRESVSRSQLV